MLEYADFYDNLTATTETLQCPRCSASVPATPGVCGNCGQWGHTAKNCMQREVNFMDEHRHDDSEGDHEVNSMSLGGLELRGLNSVENDSWVEVVSRRAKRWGGVNMGSVCAVNHTGCHPKGGHEVNGRFEEVKITADSGAVDHVAPRSLAKDTPVEETKASRMGVHYVAANGSEIKNEGEKRVKAFSDKGLPLNMTWQIAGVKKPLASIGRICDAGNVAVFTDKGGYIIGKSGAKSIIEAANNCGDGKMAMQRENGVYNFKIRIPVKKECDLYNRYAALAEWDNPEDKGFHRQGEW